MNAFPDSTFDDAGTPSPVHRFTPPSVAVVVHNSYPEEAVREAAYHRYLRRREAGQPPDEMADWLEAEREVLGG
ncbi:MAG: DUF2934 domain-containing protein [Verrucomicrobia bacterium]|nr:DUF2934 domain-containing protein [Verrucomicrobiota bacterium]